MCLVRGALRFEEWFEIESKRGAPVMATGGEDSEVIGNTSAFSGFFDSLHRH